MKLRDRKEVGFVRMDKKDLAIIGDGEYKKLLLDLKEKVRLSQLKAAVKVNYELLDLYWNLGKEIVEKQKQYSWGDSFLKLLSSDLRKEFPDMKGFSAENLKHIRYWYIFYNDYLIGLQAVTQLSDIERRIKSIPWGHNQRIMYKCKNVKEALFYVEKTIENGWSRTVLEHQIDGDLYKRIGNAVTNFDNRLPTVQSELAKQTIKEPYNFDFLTIRDKYDEREFKLHSYVVVELKTEKFKPEFAGQLNFYVTAVNKNMKSNSDNQTIGISKYEISKLLEKEYKSSLPSIEEIEESIKELDSEK